MSIMLGITIICCTAIVAVTVQKIYGVDETNNRGCKTKCHKKNTI